MASTLIKEAKAQTAPTLKKSCYCALKVTEEQEAGLALLAQRINSSGLQKRLATSLGSTSASHAVKIARMWLMMFGPLGHNQKLRMLSNLGDAGWEGFINLLGLENYNRLMIEACGHTVDHIPAGPGGYAATPADLQQVQQAIEHNFGQAAWEASAWSQFRSDPCYVATGTDILLARSAPGKLY